MSNSSVSAPSKKSMVLLSDLLLSGNSTLSSSPRMMDPLDSQINGISRADFDELVALASSNHVIVRGMEAFLDVISRFSCVYQTHLF